MHSIWKLSIKATKANRNSSWVSKYSGTSMAKIRWLTQTPSNNTNHRIIFHRLPSTYFWWSITIIRSLWRGKARPSHSWLLTHRSAVQQPSRMNNKKSSHSHLFKCRECTLEQAIRPEHNFRNLRSIKWGNISKTMWACHMERRMSCFEVPRINNEVLKWFWWINIHV